MKPKIESCTAGSGRARTRPCGRGLCPLSAAHVILWFLALPAISLISGGTAAAPVVGGEIAYSAFLGGAGNGDHQGAFTGMMDVNHFLGADRFYDAGWTGSRTVMANIEAGYIWSEHESLTHVQLIPTSGALGEVDRHATWVGMVMGGRQNPDNPGEYQQGIAPDAELFSGAIATGWAPGTNSSRYSARFNVNFSSLSTYGPYLAALQTGIAGPDGTRTADVVNSSWNTNGLGSKNGTSQESGVFDALAAANPRTLMTASAGNSIPAGDPNEVLSPATAYNNLSVAALGVIESDYDSPSFFTNSGPNDYRDPVNSTISLARQVVDIAAPGEDLATAYYGGETGGNRPSLGGLPDGPAGGPDWYSRSKRGTSFSAPIVAGGAALLYDAAYALFDTNPDARDARVIKSVLMNSADKTADWDNGQVSHANGNGGVLTTQGLDNRVGTGRMNLSRAYDQFLLGTTDVSGTNQGDLGFVDANGWDFGVVGEEMTNDYFIETPLLSGSTLSATITWFRDRRLEGSTGYVDESYDNLDLELWTANAGMPLALVSESNSMYNNSEHFSFAIPQSTEYLLRVRWTGEIFDSIPGGDANIETYALAWSVSAIPEPTSMLLVLIGSAVLWAPGRRHRKWAGSAATIGPS